MCGKVSSNNAYSAEKERAIKGTASAFASGKEKKKSNVCMCVEVSSSNI